MTTAAPRALRRVRAALLTWYDAEHRDFPWRGTRDPYAVLVSEVSSSSRRDCARSA